MRWLRELWCRFPHGHVWTPWYSDKGWGAFGWSRECKRCRAFQHEPREFIDACDNPICIYGEEE